MSSKPFSTAALLELLLKPIVRFCVRRSIKFQEFAEIARLCYVRAADEVLGEAGHERNVSRLAVTTGLQRREVTRLWKDGGSVKEQPDVLHKVIGQWRADARFSAAAESPRPLSYKGADSHFAELVQSVSRDLNPYTILFELERLKLVRKRRDTLELTAESVDLQQDVKRGCELLSADIGDLIIAVEENLFAANELPNHHIKTSYDNIVVDAIPKIRRWFLEHGATFHKEARAYLSKFDKDLQPELHAKKGGTRVVMGSFSLTTGPSADNKDE